MEAGTNEEAIVIVWAKRGVGLNQDSRGEGGGKCKGHWSIVKVNLTLKICSWDDERSRRLRSLFKVLSWAAKRMGLFTCSEEGKVGDKQVWGKLKFWIVFDMLHWQWLVDFHVDVLKKQRRKSKAKGVACLKTLESSSPPSFIHSF